MSELEHPPTIPAVVVTAMEKDFGVSVTGYLLAAVDSPPVLMGTIFGDAVGRFRDGINMRTSRIKQVFFVDGYALFRTLTGSVYVVCLLYTSDAADE